MTLPKGTCGVCRKRFALNEDGTLRPHGRNRLYGVTLGDPCRGSGQPPIAGTAEPVAGQDQPKEPT